MRFQLLDSRSLDYDREVGWCLLLKRKTMVAQVVNELRVDEVLGGLRGREMD